MTDADNHLEKSKNDPKKIAIGLLIFTGLIMGIFLIVNILINNGNTVSSNPQSIPQISENINGKGSVELLSNYEYPDLKFEISGGLLKTYNLSELKDTLKVHKIEIFDPQYEKKKKYLAFALQDVLNLGFGDQWKDTQYTDAAFSAMDGYTAIASILKLQEPGGYIVFEDLDYPGWEPVSYGNVNPAPFYLVWTGKDQTTVNEYPWPWQLESIDLIKFDSQYSDVIPKGASHDSSAYKGFEIFEGRCIRCHAMNGEGGTVGPDLNAPQSIISYRSENMIKEFIKNPSRYRHTHMPDHPDLSNEDLDNIVSYFYFMNENRN